MLTQIIELKLIYWQSRLSILAMSILLKLSYIALKLTYTLGRQVYPLSLSQSNMLSSLQRLDRWDAHLTSLDTSLRLTRAQRRQLKRLSQLLRNS
jgi:hypothetical protein